jgi:membrane-bound metal-dependent hydrolase YbcI (DUF457 family)
VTVDPFSHILLAYLLGFGIWGPHGLQFVVASAFAGALPDADVLLYPLSTRFPLLRHRGISHSIVGVTIIAGVGTFVVPHALAWAFGPGFGSGPLVDYFVALEVGGLSHVLLDAMDHWSVPIFAPFSEQEYHFDADRIMNVGAMAFTVFSYAVMIYERGRVPLWVWEVTAWLLLLAAALYFVVRLLTRWRAGVAKSRARFDDVIPQANPLVFLFFARSESSGDVQLRYARYHLMHGFLTPTETAIVPRGRSSTGPVKSPEDALARSYEPALRKSWVLGETHHFGTARATPAGFQVFWYSLEMAFFGRAAGVIAEVDSRTGTVSTRTTWRDPLRSSSASTGGGPAPL